MFGMRMGADNVALMKHSYRQNLFWVQLGASVLLPCLSFAIIYLATAFDLRYYTPGFALLIGVGFFLAMSAAFTIFSVMSYHKGRPAKMWMVLSLCLWVATVASYRLADQNYWQHSNPYFNYDDMALYVNIDPALDRGQSYMDAGQVYFKESTYVSRGRAIGFKNGDTYCVAPIVREPLINQDGTDQLETLSGFVLPKSGTVDFWAVGLNCCGANGDDFECGDSNKVMARAGMRLVDDHKRPMYLLAVQEWSATTGLPVRHPIFFHWVTNPILYRRGLYDTAWSIFQYHLFLFFVANIVLAFTAFSILGKFRVL